MNSVLIYMECIRTRLNRVKHTFCIMAVHCSLFSLPGLLPHCSPESHLAAAVAVHKDHFQKSLPLPQHTPVFLACIPKGRNHFVTPQSLLWGAKRHLFPDLHSMWVCWLNRCSVSSCKVTKLGCERKVTALIPSTNKEKGQRKHKKFGWTSFQQLL